MLAPPTPTDPSPPTADETHEVIQGIFEPPTSDAWAAIMHSKLVVCLVAGIVALMGAAYGLSRQKTYTAAATLQVGQVNPNSPGFNGYVQSAAALATAFSRAITAEPVLATVRLKLGLTPATASARLSAAPIPASPAFRVVATGPTEAAAVALANITANAVIAYEGQSNSANPEAASLLNEYREASLQLQAITANLAHLKPSKGSSSAAGTRVESEKSAAEVRTRAISNAYVAVVTSQAPRTGLVSLVAGASSASNDRDSKVEVLGLIGLLAGVVIGCVLATLREHRRLREHLSAGVDARIRRPEPI
jgi:capsular polysaccharide biosynthesis protein